MGSRQSGEIQLCFLFVCIFEFFCVFMVVLSRLFWPEQLARHLTIPPSTPAFIQPNIRFHPFSFFFMIFFLSPYHHTIHSHSIVPLTSTFLYSWVGPQTTQPVFNPDPLNGVHLQGSLWRNKDGRKIPRDSQYQRFRLPAGLVGSQTKKSFNHITIRKLKLCWMTSTSIAGTY